MKIYLASGFFTKETREEVEFWAKWLRNAGHEMFVPMEHTIPNAWDLTNEEWGKKVFEMDIKAIDECDALFYIDWGYQGDCGAAWEVGYAYAKGKKIICLPKGQTMSLMCANAVNIMMKDLVELK